MGLSITESDAAFKVMTTEQEKLEDHEHKIEYLMKRVMEQEKRIRDLEQDILDLRKIVREFM